MELSKESNRNVWKKKLKGRNKNNRIKKLRRKRKNFVKKKNSNLNSPKFKSKVQSQPQKIILKINFNSYFRQLEIRIKFKE